MIQYDPDINIYLLYLDSVDSSVTSAGLDSKILTWAKTPQNRWGRLLIKWHFFTRYIFVHVVKVINVIPLSSELQLQTSICEGYKV